MLRIISWTGLIITACALGSLATGCGGEHRRSDETAEKEIMDDEAAAFLEAYQSDFEACWEAWTRTEWEASITGKKEAFAAHAEAELALNRLHADPTRYAKIEALLSRKDRLNPIRVRALEVARLAFQEHQLPEAMIEDMAERSAGIAHAFNTFRGELDGEALSNNDLMKRLAGSKDSAEREAVWKALKQVGDAVGPDLVALAKVRNEGARKLGFEDYWDMKVRLQEHDPAILLSTFDELEELTREPFRRMKDALDAELARKFGIEKNAIRPWHYDDPFFQAAPPAEALDLDRFYKDKSREEIVAMGKRFYADIGLPIERILSRSDLYEKDGKDQHAFCEDMDRKGDVRILVNIRPTAEWMDTLLHECGHAVYDEYLDRDLPFNLRQAAHIFTTEAVAMLLGALAKNPAWIEAYAGADADTIAATGPAILEQRRREQLIFCRWTLVMLNFEKALYGDPDQDLNRLWWDHVEKYQMVTRPEGRDAADWASKPHFTIAPVYYHNYMLGELFAAQLRAYLVKLAGHEGAPSSLSFNGRKDFGEFLKAKVFAPGKRMPWPEFVKAATGEALDARHFASEL